MEDMGKVRSWQLISNLYTYEQGSPFSSDVYFGFKYLWKCWQHLRDTIDKDNQVMKVKVISMPPFSWIW